MTRNLLLGALSLCLCLMFSACAPPSEITRTAVVKLPAASSAPQVQAAELAPTAVTVPDISITGNLPKALAKEAGALDSCNADKAKVLSELKLPPPC